MASGQEQAESRKIAKAVFEKQPVSRVAKQFIQSLALGEQIE